MAQILNKKAAAVFLFTSLMAMATVNFSSGHTTQGELLQHIKPSSKIGKRRPSFGQVAERGKEPVEAYHPQYLRAWLEMCRN
uniref:Uncharacterized protein n=1 Tax=Oryza rufipogon TaxID=4529 RepID=A0A679BE14_ORYRU|nr:hypothetical protein [Oryza rufipogon]